jgi:poly-gamma-glutamate capsule biosynthesis protein CapA/YwtB (metallophosphatase superfamily)
VPPVTPTPWTSSTAPAPHSVTARLLLAGDVMLGRGVAEETSEDPAGALAGIRDEVDAADLAAANLESPLTERWHSAAAGANDLGADPASAALLAAAGLDVVGVANNHAGDAGPGTVADTLAAVDAAGLTAVGGGLLDEAFAPRVVQVQGVSVAMLALDTTQQGPRATTTVPGVAWWDADRVQAAVARARARGDLVVVGLHGGAEYLTGADPYLTRLADHLARWGADVVWGHGAHVVQPVSVVDPDGDGRPTVVATSLGNLLFDQHLPDTRRGALLEVLAGPDGIRALRIGDTTIDAGRVSFAGWRTPPPGADAVLLGNAWWQLTGTTTPAPTQPPDAVTLVRLEQRLGSVRLLDVAVGDADGDGATEVVAAFRRPYTPTQVSVLVPEEHLVDASGRSAHVGLYRSDDLRPRWVAGMVLEPVAALEVCDGALAVAYSTLDDAATPVALGAWRWGGFGFVAMPDLPGGGAPGCGDVDGNGALDPLALERTLP